MKFGLKSRLHVWPVCVVVFCQTGLTVAWEVAAWQSRTVLLFQWRSSSDDIACRFRKTPLGQRQYLTEHQEKTVVALASISEHPNATRPALWMGRSYPAVWASAQWQMSKCRSKSLMLELKLRGRCSWQSLGTILHVISKVLILSWLSMVCFFVLYNLWFMSNSAVLLWLWFKFLMFKVDAVLRRAFY